MSERVHAIVRGEVQMVGFREFVRREAESAGLGGWVRNRSDGSVEVVAEGPKDALDQLLRSLRRGPPLASVERVEVSREPALGAFQGFTVAGSS